MILKKPYAFLIKYFKIIHLILSIVMIYLAFNVNNISGFISDYINNIANSSIATTYIDFSLFVSVIFIIIISIILYILMKYKKKPKLLYLITTLSYMVIFIVLCVLYANFKTIEKEVLDPQTIRLLRDITNIILYPEYIFIIAMVIRTMGFDIKKFDFKSDIEEMDINIDDNEEVELTLGVNTDDLKRKGRRSLRELKYYVLENKIFVGVILGITLIIIIVTIVLNVNFSNKVYNQNENITSSYFNINVTDSFITSKKTNREVILNTNTSFLIVKFNINALYNYDYEYKLDLEDFLLPLGDKNYLPTLKYCEYFKDIGYCYKNQTLKYDEDKTYILVYNIPNDLINKIMTLRYDEGFVYTKKEAIAKTIKINLNPVNIDESTLQGTYNLQDIISFDKYINGTFKINSYELGTKFIYKYNYCDNDECFELSNIITNNINKKILKLDVENNVIDYNNLEFVDNFITIKYIYNGQEYTSSINNKTKESMTNYMYFDVDKNIEEASNIWLEIIVRNNKYKYVLK